MDDSVSLCHDHTLSVSHCLPFSSPSPAFSDSLTFALCFLSPPCFSPPSLSCPCLSHPLPQFLRPPHPQQSDSTFSSSFSHAVSLHSLPMPMSPAYSPCLPAFSLPLTLPQLHRGLAPSHQALCSALSLSCDVLTPSTVWSHCVPTRSPHLSALSLSPIARAPSISTACTRFPHSLSLSHKLYPLALRFLPLSSPASTSVSGEGLCLYVILFGLLCFCVLFSLAVMT